MTKKINENVKIAFLVCGLYVGLGLINTSKSN